MLPSQKLFLIAWGVVIALGIPFIPVTYQHVVREGTDQFEAHHALWGKRVKSFSATTTRQLKGIGLVLVNIRRTQDAPSAHVRVTVKERGSSQEFDIPVQKDDEFTWISLDSQTVQAGDTYTVEVSAPTALSGAPVGLRFDMESKEIAVALREKVPVWEKITIWTQEHSKRFYLASHMVIGTGVLALIFLLLERVAQKNTNMGIMLGLLFLISLTLYIRIPLSNSIDSAYGGDAFNYILKGNAWIVGEDPFAADPRKAPLYSFLTTPGLLPGLDPILWARGISILASMATVALAALFLLRLGAPLSIALGAGLLLSVNRDYQFESVQGLSNPLFAALIMASTYAFVCGKKYLVSVCAALATLTRYEGIAAAGILIPSMWVSYPSKVRTVVREAIPFLLLIAIPFLVTPFTGVVGVRTVSDLTGDEGLYIAHSWEYFLPSIAAFKLFFGRLWILVSGVGDPFAAFGWGVLVALVGIWFFQRYGHPRKALAVFPALMIVAMLAGTLWDDGSGIRFFITLLSGLTGFGAMAAVYYKPRISLPIVLMALSQVAIITAILPKNRYYLHVLPFIAIAIAGGIWVIAGAKKATPLSKGVAVCALCMTISLVYLKAGDSLSGQVSDYNEKSANQTVIVYAGRYLKKESGIIAHSEHVDLRVYVPQQRLIPFSARSTSTDEQYAKLKSSGATFVVDTAEHPYFATLIQEMPEKFQEVKTFTTRWSDVTSSIYRVY